MTTHKACARMHPDDSISRSGPDDEHSTDGWSEQAVRGSSDLFAARGRNHTSRDGDGQVACVVDMPLLRPEPGAPAARGEQGSIKDAVCP